MTTEPVGRLVTAMAVPSIVSMLISGIYNLADTFFIGRINTSSVAALGIVFSYMTLAQSFAFYFGQGSGNFISRALGAKKLRQAEEMAATGFFSSFIAGIILAAAGFVFMDPVLRFLGSTDTILPYARDYFGHILIGTPFIMCCFTLNNQMRQQGNASLSMIGIASGAVLNIILDPLFIFGLGMGISGAGLATAVSQFTSFVILLSLCGRKGGIRIQFSNFRPTLHNYAEISAGGLPSLARQGLMSVAAICLNQVAGSFGDGAVASFSVVSRIMMIASASLIGYGQGFQPVCGFNYGAGLYGRVKGAFRHSLTVSFVYCLVLAVAGYVFAPSIVRLFRADDAQVIGMGTVILRYQCLSFPLTSMIVLSNMFLQNIRRTVPAVVMAMARQGLFFIPALFAGRALFGLTGIETAQTVSDCCAFLLAVPLTWYAFRTLGRDSAAS
ncbi:MAG: MATE family efflux transporter [Candidatus Cryptobacteroides sp.]